MPWVMLAMAVMQAGMSMASQNEQQAAAKKANDRNVGNTALNQQNLLEEQVAQRGRGSLLGGMPQTTQASQQAQQSILTSNNDKQSLLGA